MKYTYIPAETPLFRGYRRVAATSAKKAEAEWKGAPIPIALWREVMAFCRHTYSEFNSECVVRLLYHPDRCLWDAVALPQKGLGMSVTETNGPERHRVLAPYVSDGWIMLGSVHHHNSGAAFQSWVDTEDEDDTEGLHVTFGKVDRPNAWTIHARVTFFAPYGASEGEELPAVAPVQLRPRLRDWIEMPPAVRELPDKLAEQAALHYMTAVPEQMPQVRDAWVQAFECARAVSCHHQEKEALWITV